MTPVRRRVIWVINSACASRCVYCDIASQRKTRELDADQVTDVARQIVAAGFREVTFVGGEPLMFPHLSAALAELQPHCETAIFTGGLPGDPTRWVDRMRSKVTRVVLSVDAGDARINDFTRGRLGLTTEVTAIAERIRREDPRMDLSVNTVVSRHNVEVLETVWDRFSGFGLTAWALTLAGDNFEGTAGDHHLNRAQVERLYLELIPELAERVKRESPDTDLIVLPTPLPFLRDGVPPARWRKAAPAVATALSGAFDAYARGDYNRAFADAFGCPLIGEDITIGVGGEVYPCSQAPIIQADYVLGSLLERSLEDILAGENLRRFRESMPHPPCRRCWAPSNIDPQVLRQTLGGHDRSR